MSDTCQERVLISGHVSCQKGYKEEEDRGKSYDSNVNFDMEEQEDD